MISKNRTGLMGWAMIIIILLHQGWFMGFPFWVFHGMGHYGVDLFMFLSGFGLWYSLEKNSTSQFYRNRFVRMLPACVVAGVAKTLVKTLLLGLPLAGMIAGVVSFDLWFIQAIVVLYALSPLFYKLIVKYKWWTFGICYIICFGMLFLDLEMFPYLLTISRVPAFLLGMFVACGLWKGNAKTLCLSFMMLIAAVVFNLIYCHHVDFRNYTFDYMILCFGLPAFCVLLTYMNKMIKAVKLNEVVEWIGRYSLELYLCHEFIFHLIKDELNYGMDPAIQLAMALGLSFACAYIIKIVSSCIPTRKMRI